MDVDVLLFQRQLRGQHLLEPERRLARRPNVDAPVVAGRHHGGVGLEVHLVHSRECGRCARWQRLGLRHPPRHVAGRVLLEGEDVGLVVRPAGHAGIAGEPLVNHRGAVGQGFFDVGDGGQFLVRHLDQRQGLFGRVEGVGRHRGDLVADEADLVPRQHRQVLEGSRPRGQSGTSAPVSTARTPGTCRARDASTRTSRACAMVLRRHLPQSASGASTSAV